jgi:hypothetical protein
MFDFIPDFVMFLELIARVTALLVMVCVLLGIAIAALIALLFRK